MRRPSWVQTNQEEGTPWANAGKPPLDAATPKTVTAHPHRDGDDEDGEVDDEEEGEDEERVTTKIVVRFNVQSLSSERQPPQGGDGGDVVAMLDGRVDEASAARNGMLPPSPLLPQPLRCGRDAGAQTRAETAAAVAVYAAPRVMLLKL